MEEKKKNIPLIVGLVIPVLMIVFIALSIYLPFLFVAPLRTDFIYSMGNDYYVGYRYTVENGKIIENEIQYSENKQSPRYVNHPDLFYYDASKNSTREISLAEAQSLYVNSQRVSPDGFEVVSGRYGGDIFLFYDSYNECRKYLKKGAYSRKFNMSADRNYCYSFQFLGWTI